MSAVQTRTRMPKKADELVRLRKTMRKRHIRSRVFESPMGPLLARAYDGRLVQLSFHGQASGDAVNADGHDDALLELVQSQIGEYFAGRRTRFDLPLEMRGPEFHRRVWAALLEIPYGKTVSYGELGAKLGDPGSARAVGVANGANPIAIIVPCHRVIGSDGSLVGYGGGLHRKQMLLDLEGGRISLAL